MGTKNGSDGDVGNAVYFRIEVEVNETLLGTWTLANTG